MRNYFIYILLVASFAPRLLAGTLTAEVDKTVGTVDDQFTYTLTIEGDADGDPKPPSVDGLDIQGAGTSSSRSWVNGKYSKQEQYNFIVTPKKAGNFTIPSVKLKVDGEAQATAPITLKISQTEAEAGQATKGGESSAIYIERELSPKEAYVGEQVISKIRIYHRVQLYEASADKGTAPAFKTVPIEGEKASMKTVNGQQYRVIEIAEVLIPMESGKLEVPTYSLKVKIAEERGREPRQRRTGNPLEDFFGDNMFSRTRAVAKTIHSKPATINVRPLPTVNKPKDFSGIVGAFELSANLSANDVSAGDTVTLTVTVKGRGPLDTGSDVSLKLDPKIKVYVDKPVTEQSVNGAEGIKGKRIYKFALVPTQAGTYDLGDIKLPIFTPEIGNYVDLTASLGKLSVTGNAEDKTSSAGPGGTPISKEKVKVLSEDLIDNHRGPELLRSQDLRSGDELILGLITGMPIGFLVLGLVMTGINSRRKKSADTKKAKSSKAFGKLKKGYEKASDVAELSHCFKIYLGDKLGEQGAALTAREFYEKLKAKGVNEPLAKKVGALIDEFSRFEYAGLKPKANDLEKLGSSMNAIAKEVERQC